MEAKRDHDCDPSKFQFTHLKICELINPFVSEIPILVMACFSMTRMDLSETLG